MFIDRQDIDCLLQGSESRDIQFVDSSGGEHEMTVRDGYAVTVVIAGVKAFVYSTGRVVSSDLQNDPNKVKALARVIHSIASDEVVASVDVNSVSRETASRAKAVLSSVSPSSAAPVISGQRTEAPTNYLDSSIDLSHSVEGTGQLPSDLFEKLLGAQGDWVEIKWAAPLRTFMALRDGNLFYVRSALDILTDRRVLPSDRAAMSSVFGQPQEISGDKMVCYHVYGANQVDIARDFAIYNIDPTKVIDFNDPDNWRFVRKLTPHKASAYTTYAYLKDQPAKEEIYYEQGRACPFPRIQEVLNDYNGNYSRYART